MCKAGLIVRAMFFVVLSLCLQLCLFADEPQSLQPAGAIQEEVKLPTLLLLISEQNIEGPQRAWWASQIDLSTVESKIAQALIENNYDVLEPSELSDVLVEDKAFQILNISEDESISLAKLKDADFVVLGKSIASAGSNIVSSNMRSCFANITVKLIRVKDGQIVAYLDSEGSTPHTDVITGGRQALVKAADHLSKKIMNALSKQGGKL